MTKSIPAEMTDQVLTATMKRTARLIRKHESAQRQRMAYRFDLAVEARARGMRFTEINELLEVRNMQATINQGRPS